MPGDHAAPVWRGPIDAVAVEALHGEAFGHAPVDHDWTAQLEGHSLGWVTVHHGDRLVGFVNVAWDGAGHAFVIDTIVAASHRRRGVGAAMVHVATERARDAGCEWLHVDFDPEHAHFYWEECGFNPAHAGTIEL